MLPTSRESSQRRRRPTSWPVLWSVVVALLAVGLASSPAALLAQREPRLVVQPSAQPARQGPRVQAVGALDNGRLRDLLRNGFPTRLHFRVELWSTGGLLNDLEGSAEWDVVVRLDALDNSYHVARIVGERITLLGRYGDIAQAQMAVERPFTPPIAIPRRGRRYYYHARVAIETLSLSDLDEVDRWLRGELGPAVRGDRNPGTALGRGLSRLLIRVVGGERRQLEARTGTFFVPR
ncbi:MAG: hypothetical protein ACYC2G_07410 [Gemmatimonadaceae bacterium]